MILCSQAKLENDNRGVNVKRGLRNKCEVGIRPGMAPIGYQLRELFLKVANQGYSGRTRIDSTTDRFSAKIKI